MVFSKFVAIGGSDRFESSRHDLFGGSNFFVGHPLAVHVTVWGAQVWRGFTARNSTSHDCVNGRTCT